MILIRNYHDLCPPWWATWFSYASLSYILLAITFPLMKAELIFFTVSPRLASNFMEIRSHVYKQFREIYIQCTKPIDRQGWFAATIMEDGAWMLRLEINSQDEVSEKFRQNRQLETLVLRTDKTLAITTVIEPWLVFLQYQQFLMTLKEMLESLQVL